jgi:predicted ATP-binding protein involved in virulence
MKIDSFKAEGVHDYLKFDITFLPDLTFLIGINGSGKTSALKLILGLTSPSYQYLNQVSYEFCEVVCSNNNKKNIIIRAEQNKTDNTFTITLTLNGKNYPSEPIKRFLKSETTQYDLDELSQIEQRHKEAFDELEVTRRIRELATPKFLGLDRRIYEGVNNEFRIRNRRQFIHPKYRSKRYDGFPEPQAIDLSLEEVQLLVFDYIRQIPQQQFQISDEFKEKLFKESFKFYEDYSIEEIPPTSKIIERKEKVLKAIDDLGIKYLNYYINDFFSKTEKIAREIEQLNEKEKSQNILSDKYRDILSKWYLNGNQLKRIDDIITYSQDYQKKIVELRAPLKKLEELTSNFLKEGRKVLRTEADGEIKIELKNGNKASIFELSSGEKQIIIMIAHLIFEEAQKTSGVFIIDEPELSLHIAWQEIFVQSIMQASPNTQFILATHSPSIVSKVDKEKHCQDLNKLNF